MLVRRHRGFTLVEITITVAILAIALGIAMPSYDVWIRKIHIRNAAENVLHALQLARSEAIKRNGTVTLTLTGGTGWTMADSGGTEIQSRPSGEGDSKAQISITQPATVTPFTVSFTSLGRQLAPGAAVSLSFSGNAATECTSTGPAGCMVVEVSLGGLIRMCDPSPSKSGTPQGC